MKNVILEANFDQIQEYLQGIDTDTLLFVVDHLVWGHYSKKFNLENIQGKKVHLWKAINGENVKNLKEYESCLEFFLEKGVHRRAHLVAIGGGATSDFAGFVAATLLRGIRWSVLPTTLLSMVDASVGGKVGVNSRVGKNLIGAFHSPDSILINQEFLETLPEIEMRSGKGEVLKYCFLDESIAKLVTSNIAIGELIIPCVNKKLEVVVDDPNEQGLRKVLNLGHTFGHAIERFYQLPHGEAVVWGMALVFTVFGQDDLYKKLQGFSRSLNLGIYSPPWKGKQFPLEDLMSEVAKDKKKTSLDVIDMVCIKNIGHPEITPMKIVDLQQRLERKEEELKNVHL